MVSTCTLRQSSICENMMILIASCEGCCGGMVCVSGSFNELACVGRNNVD